MSVCPPEAARYRAAAVIASSAFHGSATPSPFASTPQRSQVDGMNCIQPIAPAELGPMLRPKFDSTLLIAASTCHGTWYSAPACCQIASSCGYESCRGDAGGVSENEAVPGSFGTSGLGTATGAVAVVGTILKTSAPADP